MLFAKNPRRIIEDEIKGKIRQHRERNNLTYTMTSKLATATQDFEIVMTNSLGASIPYSLKAPRNGKENRKHCATILEIHSPLRRHVVLVSNGHGETRRCTEKVSKMIRGLKHFYTNREMYNSVLWQGSEIPTARKSSPAQPSTAHTELSTGFSILCTTERVPSSSRTLQLWKGTTEMCKIETGLTKKVTHYFSYHKNQKTQTEAPFHIAHN